MTIQALVVKTIRPDTVFIPYHWAGLKSANQLTHSTLDPRSKIPEFKVSACRIEKTVAPPDWSRTAKAPGRSQHAPKRELRVIQ